jgi:hypothetical protein
MWDMTVGNQLAGVYGIQPGLERPQAYPYLTELGDVYALANFEQAADYADKDSMLDWESETLSNYTTGTIAIASGVVTLTGGAFPNYGGNPVYPLRLYVGSTIYSVASYDSATQLTLTNLTVNASAGTSYKFASWDYRETDPFYAANDGEWQQAHNEFAHALSLIDARAFNNRARVGVYELPVMTWRRDADINDDYATWVANVTESSSFTTASGFTLVNWIKSHRGKVFWANYVAPDSLGSDAGKTRWLTRVQRIMETYRSLGIPNAPLFRPVAADGATPIPDAFQLQMLDLVQAYQPYQWAFWGGPGEYSPAYIAFIEEYTRSLPWGGEAMGMTKTPAIGANFSPINTQLLLGV